MGEIKIAVELRRKMKESKYPGTKNYKYLLINLRRR